MIEEIKNCSNCSPRPNKMISAYFHEGLTNCVHCGRLLSSTQSVSQTKQELIEEIEKWRVEQIEWYKSGNDESFKDQAGERIVELMALGYQLKKLSNK